MISLPIPINTYEKFDCYFIQYDMNAGTYNNYKLHVDKLKDSDRLDSFRARVQ